MTSLSFGASANIQRSPVTDEIIAVNKLKLMEVSLCAEPCIKGSVIKNAIYKIGNQEYVYVYNSAKFNKQTMQQPEISREPVNASNIAASTVPVPAAPVPSAVDFSKLVEAGIQQKENDAKRQKLEEDNKAFQDQLAAERAEKEQLRVQMESIQKEKEMTARRAANASQVESVRNTLSLLDESILANGGQAALNGFQEYKEKILEMVATDTPMDPNAVKLYTHAVEIGASRSRHTIQTQSVVEQERIANLKKENERLAAEKRLQDEQIKAAAAANPNASFLKYLSPISGAGAIEQQGGLQQTLNNLSAATTNVMSTMMVGASNPVQEFYSGAAAFRTKENDSSLIYIGASSKTIGDSKHSRLQHNLSQMKQEFEPLANITNKYAPLVDIAVGPSTGFVPKPTKGMEEYRRREGHYPSVDHLALF